MAKISLSPPWIIYYKEVDVFFKKDPEVRVVFDEDNLVIRLYVENGAKATALSKLLPTEKEFGGTVLKIEIIPANTSLTSNPVFHVIQAAFMNNPIVSDIKVIPGIFAYDLNYVLFERTVVQYFTDNLGDYNGYCSTLYENIARDIFEDMSGVFYCTSDYNHGFTCQVGTTSGNHLLVGTTY